jgi:CDP-6-deoxy-D-xylo-4-hexulose-3-dehydrase
MPESDAPRRYVLAEDTIDQRDLGELIEWLSGNPWLTQGPLTQEFERRWGAWLGTPYNTFVNSGSSANLLMYYATLCAGRLRNMKIIVPAVAWATTVAPAVQFGFEPIMCEADWRTFGLDLDHLETLLREHEPSAVIAVQVLGVPCDMDGLMALKRRHEFFFMEDACAATGSTYAGQRVGTFGDLASFSFFFGHHLSTIEGGMVSTSDEELHEILLQIRSHGWPKNLSPEKEALKARKHGVLEFNRPFTFYYPGFNVRSTDLNARIGLSQLARVGHVVARRVENHRRYQARFAAMEGFHVQENPRAEVCSISFAALAASLDHRDRVGEALRAAGVETRPLGGGSMSRQPFWAERYGAQTFTVADRIHERSFMMPNHPRLSLTDVDHICDVVAAVSVVRR